MPFAYPQVELNSIFYTTFSSELTADQYLAANIAATTWQAIPSTDHLTKGRALVTATRWLDMQEWQGALVDIAQEHSFPRTGLVYPDGTAVDSATLPLFIVQAEIELANSLVVDPELMTTLHAPLAKELKAGSASISFFRPSAVQVLAPLPSLIMNIIGPYLAGAAASMGPQSHGTHSKSNLDRDYGFLHGI